MHLLCAPTWKSLILVYFNIILWNTGFRTCWKW